MFCWIAIMPDARVYQWRDRAVYSRSVLQTEALEFGIEGVLNDVQLTEAEDLGRVAGIRTRSGDVDDFWSARISGFRPPTVANGRRCLRSAV